MDGFVSIFQNGRYATNFGLIHQCCLFNLNLLLTVTSSVTGWHNAVDPMQCTRTSYVFILLPGWGDTCVCRLFDCMTHCIKHAKHEQETTNPKTFLQPYQTKNLKIFHSCAILIRFLFIKNSMHDLIHFITCSGNF